MPNIEQRIEMGVPQGDTVLFICGALAKGAKSLEEYRDFKKFIPELTDEVALINKALLFLYTLEDMFSSSLQCQVEDSESSPATDLEFVGKPNDGSDDDYED